MKEKIEKIIIEAQLGNIGSWKAAQQVLDLFAVSNNEVSVCECEEPDIFESSQMGYGICLNCSKKVKQTDC